MNGWTLSDTLFAILCATVIVAGVAYAVLKGG